MFAIEVKSCSDFKKHKGLNNLIKDNNYNNIEVSDYITYIPIYLVSFVVC